jgi:hypothetical protein
MAHQDNRLCAVIKGVFDGGQCASNPIVAIVKHKPDSSVALLIPLIVGDVALLVKGDVEVNATRPTTFENTCTCDLTRYQPHQDALALQINLINAELGHGVLTQSQQRTSEALHKRQPKASTRKSRPQNY